MSDRDEFGRYEADDDERREAYFARQFRRKHLTCLCGYPDWPGQCPGPANCPVHGEDLSDE
jgi:hypothetical protein